MAPIDRAKVRKQFGQVVKMAAPELLEWLETPESRKVGIIMRAGCSESVGHASGRRIISILGKRRRELDEDDFSHMRKVVGFVHRHRAQRPVNIFTSRWRYSLMNWGHDPTKEA